jgi:hypothetical protein
MSSPNPIRAFVCDITVGNTELHLVLRESPEMCGWTYFILDWNSGSNIVPESPVPNPDVGKYCAETIVREQYAFSEIRFDWRPSTLA